MSGHPNPRLALYVLLTIVFIDMVGFGIIIPFLPFWAEEFNATEDEVALLMTVYSVFQFVFAIPLGSLSDRVGRKPILLLTIFGSFVTFGMLGLANSLVMIFAARAIGGLTGANIAVAQAYIADVTEPEDRAKGMGMMGAAVGLGFIVGPALGGLLAGSDADNPDYRTTFFVAAGVSLLATLAGLVFLREPERHRIDAAPEGGLAGRLRNFGLLLAYPGVAYPIVTGFIVGFAMAGLEATFALWTNRAHGWGASEVGFFFAYIGVLLVIVQGGLVGRLSRRFGDPPVLSAGVLLLAAGMALVPFSTTEILVFAAGGLISVGYALSNPALNAITSKAAPPDRQGAIMGVLQSMQSLSRMLGPAAGGVLFYHLGRDAPYVGGAVVLAIAFLMTLRLLRTRPEALREPAE